MWKIKGLDIKKLILYHTEDTHSNDKDILYKEEAKQYFDNNGNCSKGFECYCD